MRSRPAISLAATASLALGSGVGAPVAVAAPESMPQTAAAVGVSVKVGQAASFTRIEFDGVQPRSARREGDDLVLQFGQVAPPNLTLLRVDPPRYLTTASTRDTAAGLELRLTLAKGVEAKVGRADGGAYVNLSPGAGTPAPADQTAVRKAGDPVPASGVVKAQADMQHGALLLRFDWRAPVGAAVFRRGEAIWLVFDAKARLDLSEIPDGLSQARHVELVPSQNATAIRILAPEGVLASLDARGASWTLSLGPAAGAQPASVAIKPDAGGLSAQMAGATGVFWLDDPAVGDRLAVVTALGPAKGVLQGRRLVDADIYASVQGLALAPLAQDLSVSSDGDVVRIGRPSGMQLSAGVQAAPPLASAPGLPRPTAMPALIDFEGWSRTGAGGFTARYDSLLQGASDEGVKGKAATSTQARFGFARLSGRFGAGLRGHRRARPDGQDRSASHGHAGISRTARGRPRHGPAATRTPRRTSPRPFSPMIPQARCGAAMRRRSSATPAGARQAFAAGRSVLDQIAPAWRVRFLLADGEAALATGDMPGARMSLQEAAHAEAPWRRQRSSAARSRQIGAGGRPFRPSAAALRRRRKEFLWRGVRAGPVVRHRAAAVAEPPQRRRRCSAAGLGALSLARRRH